MFVKISTFHFGDVIGPALWIVGAAVWLAAGSLLVYFRSRRAAGTGGAPDRYFFRRLGIFGVLLIGAGLCAQAFLGRPDVLDERYEFKAPAKNDVARIYYKPVNETISIPLTEITRKPSYKIVQNPETIQMNANGYVETPFIYFGEGQYCLELMAGGTYQKNDNSKIVVGFIVIGKDGTNMLGKPQVFELSPEQKKYLFVIPESRDQAGAVRIEFVNNATQSGGFYRIVTITGVVLRRIEGT